MSDFNWHIPDYTETYEKRSAAIKRIRDNPSGISALKEFYKTHPVEFINDWGMTSDPRNAEIGIPVIVPFILFPRQQEFIQFLYDHWRGRKDGLAEKSRDMGVSWLCVAFGAWMWLFHTGSVVGFGSRKEEYVDKLGDPKSLFWKIREFIKLLPVEFRPQGFKESVHAPFMRIVNPENGATIIGEAGDNIGRGNRTSVYFKDESAFYDRADAIDAALSQTSNCKIDVSTPNGAGNAFYRKRHSGKIDVFVFDWRDDPRKGQEWYERQKQTLDPVIVAQEIDRNYTASVTNSWIPGEAVTQAMMRGPADVEAVGPLQMGIDVARFGDDKTIFTFRRGRVVYPMVVMTKLDTVDVFGRAKDEIEARGIGAVKQIAVDDIGVGGGVTDMLKRVFGRIVVPVNTGIRLSDGQNYNIRARVWRDMRTYIENGASLPNDPELQTDLTALQYMYRGGELLIESKDDAKKRGMKSPDRADSLALTFAVPVRDYQTDTQRSQAVMD
jgi:phage terminase large subunit